jgi:hypothetical protein
MIAVYGQTIIRSIEMISANPEARCNGLLRPLRPAVHKGPLPAE